MHNEIAKTQCNTKNGLPGNYSVFAKMQTRTCHLVEMLSPTPWYCFWWSVSFRNHMLHSVPEKEQNSQRKLPGGQIYLTWGAYLTAETIHSIYSCSWRLLRSAEGASNRAGLSAQETLLENACSLCSTMYPKKASAAGLACKHHWISARKMKWLKYSSSFANLPGHVMEDMPLHMTGLPKLIAGWKMPTLRSSDRCKVLTILKGTPTEGCCLLVFCTTRSTIYYESKI